MTHEQDNESLRRINSAIAELNAAILEASQRGLTVRANMIDMGGRSPRIAATVWREVKV